jgi:hypothetical protein
MSYCLPYIFSFHFYFAISATRHLFIDLKARPYPLFPLSKPSIQSQGNDDIGKGTQVKSQLITAPDLLYFVVTHTIDLNNVFNKGQHVSLPDYVLHKRTSVCL